MVLSLLGCASAQLAQPTSMASALSCGTWLGVSDPVPTQVTLAVLPHLGCPNETYPFSGIWPYYGDEYTVILTRDPLVFEFHAPHGGEYTYTLGSTCGTCAAAVFRVPVE